MKSKCLREDGWVETPAKGVFFKAQKAIRYAEREKKKKTCSQEQRTT